MPEYPLMINGSRKCGRVVCVCVYTPEFYSEIKNEIMILTGNEWK